VKRRISEVSAKPNPVKASSSELLARWAKDFPVRFRQVRDQMADVAATKVTLVKAPRASIVKAVGRKPSVAVG